MCYDGKCRPIGFLLGLPFALLSLVLALIGAAVWIVGIMLACICPCCLCIAVLVDLSLELIKLPLHIMEGFISLVPC